jgi:hypothetical protein
MHAKFWLENLMAINVNYKTTVDIKNGTWEIDCDIELVHNNEDFCDI